MGESLDFHTIRPVLGNVNRWHDNQHWDKNESVRQWELSITTNQKPELPNDIIRINVWLPSDWHAYITRKS